MRQTTIPHCDRCGSMLEAVETTRLGDPEPRWTVTQPCPCPGPRCPTCHRRLTNDERCDTTGCPIDGHPVPIPEVW